MSGIYKFTNKYNRKVYIGKANDIYSRYKEHLYNIKRKRIKSYFVNALRKYGKEGFDFEVIMECPKQNLDYWEKFYIKYYCSNNPQFGYNMTSGGDGGSPTEETREKIRISTEGKHATFGMLGKHQSEYQKQTVKDRLTGRQFTEEHKQNLRKPKKDTSNMYKHTGDHWYHLNEINVLIKPDKITYYESLGYIPGRYIPKRKNN